jgi:hypothetical protein
LLTQRLQLAVLGTTSKESIPSQAKWLRALFQGQHRLRRRSSIISSVIARANITANPAEVSVLDADTGKLSTRLLQPTTHLKASL